MSNSYCAIFNHVDAALRDLKNNDKKACTYQLQRFVLPTLAELAIANDEVVPGCQQWTELITALHNTHKPIKDIGDDPQTTP